MEKTGAKAFLLGMTLCCPAAYTAYAAETGGQEITLDPVTVTARGYAASQSDTPGGVGVATDDDIMAAARKGSIVDALERLPGIARTGDSPWAQDISIRGLSGPSVVILLDGKRINTATDMNARLGFINPADVERVEVLKGPVSALYGSGSIGGVVNIITRKPSFTGQPESHGDFSASGGSNPGGGSFYGSASASGEKAWVFASGAYRDYGNTYGGHDSRLDNSGFTDKQGRVMVGLKPSPALTLQFEALRSLGKDIGIPGGVSSMPELARVSYSGAAFSFLGLDAVLDLNAKYLKTLEANFYYTENKRYVRVDRIPPGPSTAAYPLELRPTADHQTWGGKLQGTFETEAHVLVAGLDFWTWEVESVRYRSMYRPAPAGGPIQFHDSPTPDARQVSVGVFAEDNWKLDEALTLNLGGRLDYLRTKADPMYNVMPAPGPNNTSKTLLYGRTDESDLGWHLHAGLTWKMDQRWSQSLLLASSYRAADIMERYKYINLGGSLGSLYGNPELDPEQSFYVEYGLHYDKKPWRADLRLFGNSVSDYIAEKRVSADRVELDNVDDARIYGAELEGRWQFLDNWGLFGNVTALYGRDRENHQALPGVAPVSGRLGVDFTHASGFWARADTYLMAAQHRTPDNVDGAHGVATLNAALGYRRQAAGLKHELALSLDNILDARYRNYLAHQRGYTLWEPGFSATLTYRLRF
ncbi:MAG: TonB-dependent receptor [Candidatus Accumulibacter sp.]|nr:TonB-dependent receptor [Accumulibacter sp.]